MFWEQKVEYAALSDIGFRRRNNEDAYVVHIAPDPDEFIARGHFFLVADGMGGHAVGELASKMAADIVPHTYYKLRDTPLEAALPEALYDAHEAIHARGEENRDFARMGTTCSTLVLSLKGAIAAHVGDSRVYRVRAERIEQLTFDHSLQWELLRQGKMSAEDIMLHEPRNIITRCLGPEANVQIDVEGPYPVRPGDVYVLCTDGLSGLLNDEEIGIISGEMPPAEACQTLVDLANLRGGPDNVTVIIARVGDAPAGAAAPHPLPEHVADDGMGWLWFAGVLFVSLTFVAGQALLILEKRAQGLVLEVLAILGIGALLLAWLRVRRRRHQQSSMPELTPGGPYRSAPARITQQFLSEVGNIEYHLQRTAHEEGWQIDWVEHKLRYQAAKTALAEKRYREALREYGRTLHVLMASLQVLRKQRDLMQRWGLRPPAPAARNP